MDDPTTVSAQALECLGGKQAPREIADDLAVLPMLPLAARRQLYRVLGPCLVDPVPPSNDEQIDAFCRELSVEAALLARVIRACRYLLRQAAFRDLSEASFAEDLVRLGDAGEIREVLGPGYEMVKQVVRAELVRNAVAEHGKVVERIAWRVDHVTATHQGDNLDLPIAVMTLWYREGEKEERVTLQVLPSALEELRAMCDRFQRE